MANRRMFSKSIAQSDKFLDLPLTSQLLYFHLGLEADDEGFVSPKKVARMVGLKIEDLKPLIQNNFVIAFETGVIVITHWKENNYIQKDRFKASIYVEESEQLSIDDNNFYIMDTECIHNGYNLDTQVRIGKDRLGKVREREVQQLEVVDNSLIKRKFTKRTEITEDVFKEIASNYQVPHKFVEDCWDSALNWLDAKGKRQKNYKAFLSNWVKREKANYILKSKKLTNNRGGVYVIEE